jgi:uncharacterized membrane protein
MSDEILGDEQEFEEPVWTYRGHRLKDSEFVSALAHQFRAEVQRANVWRTRLDVTTNWAVVITGVSISIAFSQPNVHHGVLILNALLITLFLFIEARRYRYYEMWSDRVRELETDFFAAMLVYPFRPSPKWADNLAKHMGSLEFSISMSDAVGIRLRRNYLWIFFILGIAWFTKYGLFPVPAATLKEFISRAAIGPVPGMIVVTFSIVYFAVMALAAMLTLRMAHAASSRDGIDVQSTLRAPIIRASDKVKGSSTWPGLQRRKTQFLAFIFTEKTDIVAKRILTEMNRGVTSLTGQGSTVLMCAVAAKEIKSLRNAVVKEDPQASVIISSSQEIWGKGFDPLVEG